MQVKAIIISLFLAATVAAAPTGPNGNGGAYLPTNSDSSNNRNNNQSNPSLSNDIANRNGNGNTVASNNDILNFNYGATSRQVSQEVVAAMKSLSLICRGSNSEGVMSCTWQS
ncbi:hypothetical protein F4859DRAFT_508641 [Xylaria cf. heliscus]|nr:hypothetical protein F4859DRAFT_508641 [Xylaria cf. heliscus]